MTEAMLQRKHPNQAACWQVLPLPVMINLGPSCHASFGSSASLQPCWLTSLPHSLPSAYWLLVASASSDTLSLCGMLYKYRSADDP